MASFANPNSLRIWSVCSPKVGGGVSIFGGGPAEVDPAPDQLHLSHLGMFNFDWESVFFHLRVLKYFLQCVQRCARYVVPLKPQKPILPLATTENGLQEI